MPTDNDQAGSGRDVVLQNVPQAAEVTIERSGEVVTLTGEDQVNILRRRSVGTSNYTLIELACDTFAPSSKTRQPTAWGATPTVSSAKTQGRPLRSATRSPA